MQERRKTPQEGKETSDWRAQISRSSLVTLGVNVEIFRAQLVSESEGAYCLAVRE